MTKRQRLTYWAVIVLVALSMMACAGVNGFTTNDGRACYSEYEGCGVPTPYPTCPW